VYSRPDLDDHSPATEGELQALGRLIDDNTLLWFRDIRDGGSVGHLLEKGPFAVDDYLAIRRGWEMNGLHELMTLPEWLTLREKCWHMCAPWTDGLFNLFGCVGGPGYANLLLGKLYANAQRNVAAGTINTWRKEYRAYLKWRTKTSFENS
jgi:hypothetical protein